MDGAGEIAVELFKKLLLEALLLLEREVLDTSERFPESLSSVVESLSCGPWIRAFSLTFRTLLLNLFADSEPVVSILGGVDCLYKNLRGLIS